MKRVTLIITAVLTVLMLTACSSNKVVYESDTESQAGNKAWTVLIYMCGGDDESVNGDYSKKLDEKMCIRDRCICVEWKYEAVCRGKANRKIKENPIEFRSIGFCIILCLLTNRVFRQEVLLG